jgi:hypothetical protein
VHKRIRLAVKKDEFVCNRMLYIILGGRWCHTTVPNVHGPTRVKMMM